MPFLRDAQAERAFVRLGIVRLVFRAGIRPRGRANESHILFRLFAKNERALVSAPLHICAAQGCWPFELEIPVEGSFDFQWLRCVDIEQNRRSLFVYRDKESFSHGKGIAGVKNRTRFWMNRKGTRQRFRRNLTSRYVEAEMEVAEKLERVNPGFHASCFIAQERRSLPGGRQKFPRTYRPRQLERVRFLGASVRGESEAHQERH